MELIIRKISAQIQPLYSASAHYQHTIWSHVLRVSQYAKDFAMATQANEFVCVAGGLLHDIGAAMYGREDHHITGSKEAVAVLLSCECPVELIGPIVSTIYSHRGSQRLPFKTQEAICVAAADAKDHFTDLEELWMVHERDLHLPPMWIHRKVSDKLQRDWEKTDSAIKGLLGDAYEKAKKELLRIAHRNGGAVGRK